MVSSSIKRCRQAGLVNMTTAVCNLMKPHLITPGCPVKEQTTCDGFNDLSERLWGMLVR